MHEERREGRRSQRGAHRHQQSSIHSHVRVYIATGKTWAAQISEWPPALISGVITILNRIYKNLFLVAGKCTYIHTCMHAYIRYRMIFFPRIFYSAELYFHLKHFKAVCLTLCFLFTHVIRSHSWGHWSTWSPFIPSWESPCLLKLPSFLNILEVESAWCCWSIWTFAVYFGEPSLPAC